MKKILIVDDETDILTSVKMIIEKMGHEVKTANNGKKALLMLKKEKFDLVLLDILMPIMSGKEVLEKIRKDPKLKNQKVAFLSVVKLGKQGENSIQKLNPIEYFEKPIKMGDFEKRLEKILK
ncbi:response regulator [bacterium]|nr:response regulator [bacterium]